MNKDSYAQMPENFELEATPATPKVPKQEAVINKMILPDKEWAKRKKARKMQKASRKANRK